MKLHALLTVDLRSPDAPERILFYAALAARKWQKERDLSTAWIATFKEGIDVDTAHKEVAADLAHAAQEAGNVRFDATVLIGPNEPVRM